MLKITTVMAEQQTTLNLTGKLSGPWVAELNRHWQCVAVFQRRGVLIVNVTDVTFMDAEGQALLTEMWRAGVELHTTDCFTKAIVDRIVAGSGGPPSSVESEDRGD
jgi:ABC-type transporter Mla MlaB component